MATLQAASALGSSGQKGVWVLGLAPGETAEGSPEPSPLLLPSAVQTPAVQPVPLQAACHHHPPTPPHPRPRNFLLQGDSWGGGGKTLLLLSDLQLIWE